MRREKAERQPEPTRGGEAVLPHVVADIAADGGLSRAEADALAGMVIDRARRGLETYGVPLTTHNGRDALQDAREEVADALQYVTQARLEGRAVPEGTEADLRRMLVALGGEG